MGIFRPFFGDISYNAFLPHFGDISYSVFNRRIPLIFELDTSKF